MQHSHNLPNKISMCYFHHATVNKIKRKHFWPVSAEEVVLVGRVLIVVGGVTHPRHLGERLAARAEQEARGDVGLARREGARRGRGVFEALLAEVAGDRNVGTGVWRDLWRQKIHFRNGK